MYDKSNIESKRILFKKLISNRESNTNVDLKVTIGDLEFSTGKENELPLIYDKEKTDNIIENLSKTVPILSKETIYLFIDNFNFKDDDLLDFKTLFYILLLELMSSDEAEKSFADSERLLKQLYRLINEDYKYILKASNKFILTYDFTLHYLVDETLTRELQHKDLYNYYLEKLRTKNKQEDILYNITNLINRRIIAPREGFYIIPSDSEDIEKINVREVIALDGRHYILLRIYLKYNHDYIIYSTLNIRNNKILCDDIMYTQEACKYVEQALEAGDYGLQYNLESNNGTKIEDLRMDTKCSYIENKYKISNRINIKIDNDEILTNIR